MVASEKTGVSRQTLNDFESSLAELEYLLSSHSGKRITSREFKDRLHALAGKGRDLANELAPLNRDLSEKILQEIKTIFGEVYGRKSLYKKSVRKLKKLYMFEVAPKMAPSQRKKITYAEFVASNLLVKLPAQVRICIKEAMRCFNYRCYIASSVMLRKTVEIATEIRVKQAGVEDKLYDKNGNELTLQKKLALVAQLCPPIRKNVKDVETVKWFGDVGAHDPNTLIFAQDIKDNIAPKVRAYLSNLGLK